MTTYTLQPRALPLDASWEVIVVGGGPAGCTAAAAAAREGARTLLIEATGCLGGMGTAGLVPAWCPFSDKERIIYGGLAEKVFTATKAGMPHVRPDAKDWVPIDPELLKRVYDDLVTDAGVTVLFNTAMVQVETDGPGHAQVILIHNKAGLSALSARVFIDCTGDGDLAAWTGAPFEQGEPVTGTLQPATHCFVLTNVDEYGYHTGTRPVNAIVESDRYPLIPDGHFCHNIIGPATVGFNAGHMWAVDNTDPVSVSAALMQGRKMAAQFRDALAVLEPRAFGNAFLVATGSLMGIRETRRILGDYLLTVEDYFARRSFDDEICRNSYPIDVHRVKDPTKEQDHYHLYHDQTKNFQLGESHGIPYRCLTPQGLANVLVAGRCISTDRLVQGSTRVMPVCLAMGEAAGIAAAFAARDETPDVHAIDVQRLRRRLREEGGYLPEPVGELA